MTLNHYNGGHDDVDRTGTAVHRTTHPTHGECSTVSINDTEKWIPESRRNPQDSYKDFKAKTNETAHELSGHLNRKYKTQERADVKFRIDRTLNEHLGQYQASASPHPSPFFIPTDFPRFTDIKIEIFYSTQ